MASVPRGSDVGPVGFPETEPSVPAFQHGWFLETHVNVFSALLSSQTKVVAEIGSWYGSSTKWLAQHAPNAKVYAIDLWDDSFILNDDHYGLSKTSALRQMLTDHPLYPTFLKNLWGLRDRVTPIRRNSVAGLQWLKEQGIYPEIIYIDGDHHYDAVVRDIEACMKCFPNAILVGDDYGNYEDVRRAVGECAGKHFKTVHVDSNHCWTYAPLTSRTGQTIRPGAIQKASVRDVLQRYKQLKQKGAAEAPKKSEASAPVATSNASSASTPSATATAAATATSIATTETASSSTSSSVSSSSPSTNTSANTSTNEAKVDDSEVKSDRKRKAEEPSEDDRKKKAVEENGVPVSNNVSTDKIE